MRGVESRVFYSSFNISCSTSEVELNVTNNELEKDVLCSTAKEYVPGTQEADMSINGYIEGISSGLESALNSALDNLDQHVALILGYSTLPAVSYVLENAYNNGITWTAPFDGLMTVNGTVRTSTCVNRGFLAVYERVQAATGASPSVQVTSFSNADTGKAFLFLHDTSVAPTGLITIQVQSSVDNNTWSTIGTVDFNSEADSKMVAVTYTGSYVRANVTALGGTSGITYSVIFTEN